MQCRQSKLELVGNLFSDMGLISWHNTVQAAAHKNDTAINSSLFYFFNLSRDH